MNLFLHALKLAILCFISCCLLQGCSLFDGEPLIEPNDPCEEVHKLYPDVETRDCSWVLNIMRNYPPPEFLPPPTDTGGPLMAARILTDTGEVLFVAQGVPDRFLMAPCTAGGASLSQSSNIVVAGSYCDRSPVDTKSMVVKFYLDDSLGIYQEADRARTRFTYQDALSQSDYELRTLNNFLLTSVKRTPSLRILSGEFETTLHNRRDPTDSIRIVDGRFDMRY